VIPKHSEAITYAYNLIYNSGHRLQVGDPCSRCKQNCFKRQKKFQNEETNDKCILKL